MSIGATRCSPITCQFTYLRPTCSPIYPASSQRRVTSEPSPSLGIRASPSNVRRDDRAFLEFAQQHYGLGEMRLVPERGGSRPTASWRVGRLADIARLAEILNGYPPRGR